jgi:hypothetical protein
VETIAESIPTIPNIFPNLADLGDDSPFNAKIKHTEENKYTT